MKLAWEIKHRYRVDVRGQTYAYARAHIQLHINQACTILRACLREAHTFSLLSGACKSAMLNARPVYRGAFNARDLDYLRDPRDSPKRSRTSHCDFIAVLLRAIV